GELGVIVVNLAIGPTRDPGQVNERVAAFDAFSESIGIGKSVPRARQDANFATGERAGNNLLPSSCAKFAGRACCRLREIPSQMAGNETARSGNANVDWPV